MGFETPALPEPSVASAVISGVASVVGAALSGFWQLLLWRGDRYATSDQLQQRDVVEVARKGIPAESASVNGSTRKSADSLPRRVGDVATGRSSDSRPLRPRVAGIAAPSSGACLAASPSRAPSLWKR